MRRARPLLLILALIGLGSTAWLVHTSRQREPDIERRAVEPSTEFRALSAKVAAARTARDESTPDHSLDDRPQPTGVLVQTGATSQRVPFLLHGASVIQPNVAIALKLDEYELEKLEAVIDAHRDRLIATLDATVVVTDLPDGFILSYALDDPQKDAATEALKRDLMASVDPASRALLEASDLGHLSEALLPYPLTSGTVQIVRLQNGNIEARLTTKGRTGSATRGTEGRGRFLVREFYGQRATAELERRGLLPGSVLKVQQKGGSW
jgi:hypothetical protein